MKFDIAKDYDAHYYPCDVCETMKTDGFVFYFDTIPVELYAKLLTVNRYFPLEGVCNHYDLNTGDRFASKYDVRLCIDCSNKVINQYNINHPVVYHRMPAGKTIIQLQAELEDMHKMGTFDDLHTWQKERKTEKRWITGMLITFAVTVCFVVFACTMYCLEFS